MFSGEHDAWFWRVWDGSEVHADLAQLVAEYFEGRNLCIVASDCGPFELNGAEQQNEWLVVGDVAISPPLNSRLELPWDESGDEDSEWYVVDHIPREFPKLENFVNFGGFTLVDPDTCSDAWEPTWDKNLLISQRLLQQRFWRQLCSINPTAYVSFGDNDIVVSRHLEFVERCEK